MSKSQSVTIRPYEPRDRADVRRLCCETGFLGKPIDPVFEDRELFADYLTSYYTDVEPESSFIMEVDGVVKGYLLGSRHLRRQKFHSFFQNIFLTLKGLMRYPGYSKTTKEYIAWIVKNSRNEVPPAPHCPHFHFNVLPEAQGIANTFAMMHAYFEYLKKFGEKAVFGQMVTFEDRRGAKVLERFGFKVINRSEVTKYRKIHPEPVYLTTVIKNLEIPDPVFARQPALSK